MTPREQSGDPPAEELAAALASEEEIAAEARTIRRQNKTLSPQLLDKLMPLLTKPIPEAFIRFVPKLQKGKPYESTGIRSVQVQIDRLNNVLGPAWWWDEQDYEDGGTVCHVSIFVGSDPQAPLAQRHASGGVDRGSSRGNLYKGSYTNAAKLAIARLGPGHEVYLGAADFDPDTDAEAAGAQGAGGAEGEPGGELSHGLAKELVDRAWSLGLKDKFRLAASHAAGDDVGDAASKAKALKAIKGRPIVVGQRIDAWLQRKADEQAAES